MQSVNNSDCCVQARDLSSKWYGAGSVYPGEFSSQAIDYDSFSDVFHISYAPTVTASNCLPFISFKNLRKTVVKTGEALVAARIQVGRFG